MTATAEAPRIEPVFNPGDVVKLYAPGDPQHGAEMVVVDGTPDEGQITVEVDGAEFLVGLDKLTVVQRAEPGAAPTPAPAPAPAPEPDEPKRDRLGRVHAGGYPRGMPRDPKLREAWKRQQQSTAQRVIPEGAAVVMGRHDLQRAPPEPPREIWPGETERECRTATTESQWEELRPCPLPLTDRELLRLIELAETTVHEPIRLAAMVILGRAV